MPYEVLFEEKERYVLVTMRGRASVQDHYGARDEALRLCREHGVSRLLIDARELDTEGLSTAGCYAFGEALARETPFVRLAHVLPPGGRARKDVQFTATVEHNRGRPSEVFDTLEEALRWLLEDEGADGPGPEEGA